MNQNILIKMVALLSLALTCGSAAWVSAESLRPDLARLAKSEITSDIYPGHKAKYYSLVTENGTRVHIADFDYQSKYWDIRPVLNAKTQSVSATAQENRASAAINGAFFNLADGQSASYITIDGQQVSNPYDNKLLMENPKLAPHLEKILNRSELRICQNKLGDRVLQIARHNDPLPADVTLVHSIQAGPQLLPALTEKEEAFVRTAPDGAEVDSIGVYRHVARTAVAITCDHHLLFICVSGKGQDPESSGLTLAELAALLKDLGCESALNFDGGASTTMCVSLDETGSGSANHGVLHAVCGKQPETKVKSVFMSLVNQ